MKSKTNVRMTWLALLGGGSLALAACEGPIAVPKNPTWLDDVRPIVQGQCAHCHGPKPIRPSVIHFAARDGSVCADVPGATPVKSIAPLVVNNIFGGEDVVPMPPPTAEPLTAEQLQLIERWYPKDERENADFEPAFGDRNNNRKPTARLSAKLPTNPVSRLSISSTIADADDDEVVGQLTITNEDDAAGVMPKKVRINGSGALALRFEKGDDAYKVFVNGKEEAETLPAGRYKLDFILCDGLESSKPSPGSFELE